MTANLALLLCGVPATAWAECGDLLPSTTRSTAESQGISAIDIATIRDIGHPDGHAFGLANPLALSPDQKSLAFVLSRGDPANNLYCRALVVIDMAASAPPRVVDRGGDFISVTDIQRNLYFDSGATRPVTPAWSPGGQHIAYVRKDGAHVRAWLIDLSADTARPVSPIGDDVEAVGWSADGTRLLYATRPGIAREQSEIDRAALHGWHYDDRIVPNSSTRPKVRAPKPHVVHAYDVSAGTITAANDAEAQALQVPAIAGIGAPLDSLSAQGRRATTVPDGPSPLADRRVQIIDPNGERRICSDAACVGGLLGLWWADDGDLVLARREGWARQETRFYRWDTTSAPKALFATSDVLNNCLARRDDFICTRERSTTPRQIVSVERDNGKIEVLFDPNPDLAARPHGKVIRLDVRNHVGLPSWADLVLPPDYDGTSPLPMVIVQYRSLGYLRGGTGNEYPIFALAERGFAVLSFERPTIFANTVKGLRTIPEITAANLDGWAERRSILSSLNRSIDAAMRVANIDPARIGITGQSDGSSGARFAILASDRFATASLGTCCIDRRSGMEMSGTAFADIQRAMGYPPATNPDPEFWAPYSFSQNAERIDLPILLQLADDEYLLALESYTALREAGQPVDMYVFENERHAKWQPAHRLAIYQRNLDWFDFWLRDVEDPDPSKHEQYVRWRTMRALRQHGGSAGAAPSLDIGQSQNPHEGSRP